MSQEQALKDHFSEHPARNVDEVCAHIEKQYAQSYSPSGGGKLMRRIGFEYKKPQLLPSRWCNLMSGNLSEVCAEMRFTGGHAPQ